MSDTDYVRLVVDSVQLTSNAYEDDYAVSKSYVDGVKSEIMGGMSVEALDTIKELSEYIAKDGVAGGLVSQFSTLSASIADETGRATAAESDLSSRISSVETAGETAIFNEQQRALSAESTLELKVQAESGRAMLAEGDLDIRVSAISVNLDTESKRAVDAEGALDSRITSVESGAEQAIADEKSRAETAEALKANLSGAVFTGDVQLADSYLQFGPQWRVKGSSDGKRLVFEYKRGTTWKTALPFITSA